jgi:transcriptional regulator with XRE-family HTH domain
MEELRRLRKEKGLSQAKLAVMAGLDPSTVSQIETGARRANTGTLERLAAVLEMEVADLFPKSQNPLPLDEPPEPRGALTLEEIGTYLERHVGSAWIAVPEEEWANWWRGVSREEATRRYRRIREEYRLLANEFTATHAKNPEREPELVPRGRSWGDVYNTLFARHFAAPFFAPQKGESERDFKKRQLRDRATASFYEELRDTTQETLRTNIEAASG